MNELAMKRHAATGLLGHWESFMNHILPAAMPGSISESMDPVIGSVQQHDAHNLKEEIRDPDKELGPDAGIAGL